MHAEQARLALEQAEQERLERELADKEHYLVVSSQVSIKGDLTQDDPLAVEKSVGELVEQETVDTAGHDSADEVSTNPEDLNDKEEKVSKKKAKKDRQKQNRITEDDKKRKGSPISPPNKETRRRSLSGGLVPMKTDPMAKSQVSATPVNKTILPKSPILSHTTGAHQIIPPTLLQLKTSRDPRKITKENRTGL